MSYEFYTARDKKGKVGDCVVRALCKVTDKSWVEVYDELCAIGRKAQKMPNHKDVYKKFLEKNGFSYVTIKVDRGDTRPTVRSMTKKYGNKMVLRSAHHLTAAVGHKYYDVFDSGHRSLYSYYIKE